MKLDFFTEKKKMTNSQEIPEQVHVFPADLLARFYIMKTY